MSASQSTLSENVFVYQAPDMQWYPSDIFTVDGFVKGLRVMYEDGVANKYFYLGTEGSTSDAHLYGLVNIAAFLAQVMKESLQYNACDENNWDLVRHCGSDRSVRFALYVVKVKLRAYHFAQVTCVVVLLSLVISLLTG